MPLTLLALSIPAAVFLFLSLMPRGRATLLACLVAACLLALLWAGHYFDRLGYRGRGEERAQIKSFILISGMSLAWFVAVSLQVLRNRFPPHWPAWSWPVVVFVTLLVIGIGVYRILTL